MTGRWFKSLLVGACLLALHPPAHPSQPSALQAACVSTFLPDAAEPVGGDKKTDPAPVPPSVTLPKTVSVAKGRLAQLPLSWDGDDVKWITPPELDVFREYDPDPKKVLLRVIGYDDATVTFVAVSCRGGKLSEFGVCVVVIGSGKPTPVPPGPNPPGPADPLTQQFQAAYDQEKNPAKLKLLTEAFDAGSMLVNDAGTAKQLFDAVHTALDKQIGVGAMPLTRKAVGAYLASRGFPTASNMPLDGAMKAIAVDAFGKAAAALKGVTP